MLSKETKERLIKLAKQDCCAAMDNLARARSAARSCDPTKQWGQNGHTLQEIIEGYETDYARAKTALDELEAATC